MGLYNLVNCHSVESFTQISAINVNFLSIQNIFIFTISVNLKNFPLEFSYFFLSENWKEKRYNIAKCDFGKYAKIILWNRWYYNAGANSIIICNNQMVIIFGVGDLKANDRIESVFSSVNSFIFNEIYRLDQLYHSSILIDST